MASNGLEKKFQAMHSGQKIFRQGFQGKKFQTMHSWQKISDNAFRAKNYQTRLSGQKNCQIETVRLKLSD
jgi:hypothetical protein